MILPLVGLAIFLTVAIALRASAVKAQRERRRQLRTHPYDQEAIEDPEFKQALAPLGRYPIVGPPR